MSPRRSQSGGRVDRTRTIRFTCRETRLLGLFGQQFLLL